MMSKALQRKTQMAVVRYTWKEIRENMVRRRDGKATLINVAEACKLRRYKGAVRATKKVKTGKTKMGTETMQKQV